jgi:hypothetical protein
MYSVANSPVPIASKATSVSPPRLPAMVRNEVRATARTWRACVANEKSRAVFGTETGPVAPVRAGNASGEAGRTQAGRRPDRRHRRRPG